MAAVTGGSSTEPMLKKVQKGLTTDIASLTTRSADLQSTFDNLERAWYMSTA
jgi:hypothetical protein